MLEAGDLSGRQGPHLLLQSRLAGSRLSHEAQFKGHEVLCSLNTPVNKESSAGRGYLQLTFVQRTVSLRGFQAHAYL